MIALLDYGAGNLTSVKKAFRAIGAEIFVPADPVAIASADAVVVPGVGHFGATAALDGPWVDAVRAAVARGRPLLGICLGMHWLFEGSREAEGLGGLGIFPGRIERLDPDGSTGADSAWPVKVPHVGWNAVAIARPASIVEGVADGTQVYFTHSYCAPPIADTVGTTTHGVPFSAIVQRGTVAGVQFHPEKSGAAGIRILRNFAAWAQY
jgi:glutamine amidotransferase